MSGFIAARRAMSCSFDIAKVSPQRSRAQFIGHKSSVRVGVHSDAAGHDSDLTVFGGALVDRVHGEEQVVSSDDPQVVGLLKWAFLADEVLNVWPAEFSDTAENDGLTLGNQVGIVCLYQGSL